MKITILNGAPEPATLDNTLSRLKSTLENSGNQVTQIDLRELGIRYCIGCFGCWVKTPGVCSSRDESCQMRRAVISSDFTLWAAPMNMGFPSALLKTALDKSIPLLHPYIVVAQGEAHHRKRYARYPEVGLLLEPEADTDAQDMEIVTDIFMRLALNFKSRLKFAHTSEMPVEQIAALITSKSVKHLKAKRKLTPTGGQTIAPPRRLTLINGSPRGRKGNTPILLRQFGEGFAAHPGNNVETYTLNRVNQHDELVEAFAGAECVWLGFPLYTDAMPGMVKAFIEKLAPLKSRGNNPPLGFLVQSGFPEALHSRYVERYTQKLTGRLGAPYLGTIVKGNGEGVRMMPEERNAKLFGALQGLGMGFAQSGALDAQLLKQVAGVERYPLISMPLFQVFLRTATATWYWDSQLKENGVYEERFARPYQTPG